MLMGGATAEGFLLPLIIGITVLSFGLTATIVLSPSAAEIQHEAASRVRASGPWRAAATSPARRSRRGASATRR
jgi:hypothetical protein